MRHSYSSLSAFLKCPRLWHAKYYVRRLPKEDDAPALRRGRDIHKLLEKSVEQGRPLSPDTIWTPPGLIEKLHQAGARTEVMYKTDHMIGFLDVELIVGPIAWMGDWKTGKYRVDELQADVYSYLLWKKVDPTLVPKFNLIYVDAKKVHPPIQPDKRAIARVENIMEQAEKMGHAAANKPSPGWPCKWCPVLDCEHNRREQ